MSVNRVILLGRLGQDPEVRYGQTGNSVCNFSLATSESWQDKATGKKQEKTEWHRIVVWGRLAEICGQYLAKGRQVYVEGRLQTRSWDDKDGVKKYTTEIVAQTVQFLGNNQTPGAGASDSADAPRGDFNDAPPSSGQFQSQRPPLQQPTESRGGFVMPPEDHFTTDDIPF